MGAKELSDKGLTATHLNPDIHDFLLPDRNPASSSHEHIQQQYATIDADPDIYLDPTAPNLKDLVGD